MCLSSYLSNLFNFIRLFLPDVTFHFFYLAYHQLHLCFALCTIVMFVCCAYHYMRIYLMIIYILLIRIIYTCCDFFLFLISCLESRWHFTYFSRSQHSFGWFDAVFMNPLFFFMVFHKCITVNINIYKSFSEPSLGGPSRVVILVC